MKAGLAAACVLAAFAGGARADVDFRGLADAWRIGRGFAADRRVAARQIANAPEGVRVTMDAAASDLRPWNWGSINALRKVPIGTLAEGDVLRLRLRCGDPPLVVNDVSIGVADEKGRAIPWKRLPIVVEGDTRVFPYRLDFSKRADIAAGTPCFLSYVNFGMESERGEVTFVSLAVAHEGGPRSAAAAAETLALDVETGNPLHLVRTSLAERATLVWSNRCDAARSWRGSLTFEGPDGTAVTRETAFALPPHAIRRERLPAVFPQMGVWRVRAALACDDGSQAACATRFAQIDHHVVRPKLPFGKFRFGLSYHMTNYHGRDRELTLDALTAIGVQIVHVGGLWYHDYEYFKGHASWAIADEVVSQLEARGIAICAAAYANPPWAVKADGSKAHTFGPAAPGFQGAYCERLARRFGERVDYYEIGNEWDLHRTNVMTIAEGVTVTREAAEGLKRGCPKARVIPSGWAVESSDHPAVTQKGFQEEVTRRCADVLDVHPIHVHGPWAMHATRMREFFAMRTRNGITLPWFANETAVTSVWGQERAAAETLWKKIVWSWAHGSTDYLWYNLRATGTAESDAEGAYGIITRDYYPRDAFAAFSALATLLRGYDFTSMTETPFGRALYSFAGERAGVAERVFVAWDRGGGKGFPLRVRTGGPRSAAAVSVECVDLYGNRKPLALSAEGEALWQVEARPCALVVRGPRAVAAATVDSRDLTANEVPSRRILRLGERMRLADYTLVSEIYQANPDMLHRLWMGPADLSAELLLTAKGETLELTLDVTDDRAAKGDRVRVRLGNREIALERRSRADGSATYRASWPRHASATTLSVALDDDDGEGVDVRLAETLDFAEAHDSRKEETK